MSSDKFEFKQFTISQAKCAMKVGTDAVLLGAWVDTDGAKQILDVGTGTGVIAMMLAQKSTATITAVDIDSETSAEASCNFNQSLWNDRLSSIHLSFQEFASSSTQKFDLIVSNPPYFIDAFKSTEQARNKARHADELPFEELISGVLKLLQPHGRLCVILPTREGITFRELASENGLYLNKIMHVKTTQYKDEKRQLLQFSLINQKLTEETLIIEQEERHSYSQDYIELTKDFYLSF